MAFSLRFFGAACLALTLAALPSGLGAQAVTPLVMPKAPQPLLPRSFAGWTPAAPPRTGATPDAGDLADADVLKEYGFKDYAAAGYTRGGHHLTVRARRFADATGAYGAFTFYRHPGMHVENIGTEAAAAGNEVLFWTGNTLVDAIFDAAPDKSALKALADAIPAARGPDSVAPALPQHLPAQGLQPDTVHYYIGPAAYARSGAPLPSSLIDFTRDPEVVTAQYANHDGKGALTIVEYPTPQIAIARAKAIEDQLKPGTGSAAPAVHRSGPLVAVTSGDLSFADARDLLDKVKYEAEVTVDHARSYVSEVKKTARLVLGIIYLTFILGGSSMLVGLFLGGGRALIRRLRGKPISSLNDEDFITLNLGS
ncbi:MAG: hypothetical protein JO300_05800 [Silvibacterium sp.]|nr:hypothetical protein [Silvibacterium sp.]